MYLECDNIVFARKFVEDTIKKYGNNAKFNLNGEQCRLFVYDDRIYRMPKGIRKYGYRVDNINTLSAKVVTEVSVEEKFNKNLDRIIKLLLSDGLWAEELVKIKFIKAMGYQLSKECYKYSFGNIDEEKLKELATKVRKAISIAPQEVKEYFNIATSENEKDIIYLFRPFEYLENAKIKKMRFNSNKYNKCTTEYVLNNIAKAIDNKENYCTPRYDNGYDVSFEYNAEKQKAWYSEEYRNCGNGHYYIALNRNYALHIEDD